MRYLIRGPVTPRLLEMADAWESDTDDVLVLDIFSEGGCAASLVYLLNVLQKVRRRGKKIVTYNSGIALSAGATLLVQGNEIYLGDASLTMFHECVDVSITAAIENKLERAWRWLTGKRITDTSDMLNQVLTHYEPWDYILRMYGDKKIRGDYVLTSQEMEELLDNAKVADLPEQYEKLELWEFPDAEEMVIGEIPADVAEAVEEAIQQAQES